MADKTASIVSPMVSKKRLRRGAEGRRVEEIEKTRALTNTQILRGIVRRPTRVLPEVPGFSTLNKIDYKRDHKDITKHAGVSSIFFDTDTEESEDEQGFSSILGANSLLVRSQYPPVAAQSSIAKKKRRYATWVSNSSAIQNDLSTYKSTIEQVQQQLEKVEQEEVMWAESFELTRRQLITSITDVRTAIHQSDQDALLLYDFCIQECGLSRKKKFPYMSDILGKLDDSQHDILEGIKEYSTLIASASTTSTSHPTPTSTTYSNGYDNYTYLPVFNITVDELNYPGDKESISLRSGDMKKSRNINKNVSGTLTSISNDAIYPASTSLTEIPRNHLGGTEDRIPNNNNKNSSSNSTTTTAVVEVVAGEKHSHISFSNDTNTTTTGLEYGTNINSSSSKNTRMKTRHQLDTSIDTDMEYDLLSSYFTAIESTIKERTSRLVDLDPFLPLNTTTTTGTKEGEQEEIPTPITTTTTITATIRPVSNADKNKLIGAPVTTPNISGDSNTDKNKQHHHEQHLQQQQQFAKQLLEFRQSDTSWAKVLRDVCTPSSTDSAASRPKRRGSHGNGGGSTSKRIVTISSYPMHWAPRGIPLLLSPLSLLHDKVVGAMYSIPTSDTTLSQIRSSLTPMLLFQNLSAALRKEELDQCRVNDLRAELLRLQHQIKCIHVSAQDWEKRSVDSYTAFHRAEATYSFILYEEEQAVRRSSKELTDYEVNSWNAASTATTTTTETGWEGTSNEFLLFPTHQSTGSTRPSKSRLAGAVIGGGGGGGAVSKRSNKSNTSRQQQYYTTAASDPVATTSVVALGDLSNDLAIKALQRGGSGSGHNRDDMENDVDGTNDMSIASSVSSINDTYDRNMSYVGGGGGNSTKPKRVIGVRTNKKTTRRVYG